MRDEELYKCSRLSPEVLVTTSCNDTLSLAQGFLPRGFTNNADMAEVQRLPDKITAPCSGGTTSL
jgi:hypothetical protein